MNPSSDGASNPRYFYWITIIIVVLAAYGLFLAIGFLKSLMGIHA